MDSLVSVSSSKSGPLAIEILETHKELVARDIDTIPRFWKWIPLLIYFSCAITGYTSSILFYILWTDIFAENCPIWAELVQPRQAKNLVNGDLSNFKPQNINAHVDDWRKRTIIIFPYEYRCEIFFALCLCACLFGVVWLILFCKCAMKIYDIQWLIVVPALIFHVFFTPLLTIYQRDFEFGYNSLSSNLKSVAVQYMNESQLANYPKDCQIVNYYLEIYTTVTYNICYVLPALQFMSWVMTLIWLSGLAYLILRILLTYDFKVRTTQTYRVHYRNQTDRTTIETISASSSE